MPADGVEVKVGGEVLLGSPERHAILRIMIYLPLGRRWQPRPPLPPTRRAVGFNSI